MSNAADLVLCRAGEPRCVVVIDDAREVTAVAAAEFAGHLTTAFGAPVRQLDAMAADGPDPEVVRLVVGGVDTTDFAPEEYALQTRDGALHLGGRDEGDLFGDPRRIVGQSSPGTLYAVYHFLDEMVGVRWLWPGADGTHVPEHRDLTIPALDVRTRPDLEQRCLRPWSAPGAPTRI